MVFYQKFANLETLQYYFLFVLSTRFVYTPKRRVFLELRAKDRVSSVAKDEDYPLVQQCDRDDSVSGGELAV